MTQQRSSPESGLDQTVQQPGAHKNNPTPEGQSGRSTTATGDRTNGRPDGAEDDYEREKDGIGGGS